MNNSFFHQKTDDEIKADTFARYDGVAQLYGSRAPDSWSSESAADYRKRCARVFQGLSEKFKYARLDSLDVNTFAGVESAMLREMEQSAKARADAMVGKLIPIKRTDAAGRTITEFRGDMDVWLNAFKLKPHRIRFRKPRAVNNVIVGVQ